MTRLVRWIPGPMVGVLLASSPVFAQPAPPATTGVRVQLEGQVGALWPQPPRVVDPTERDRSETTTAALGGRLALYFTENGLASRLKFQVTGQYAEIGSSDYFDVVLRSRVRTEGHWFAVTPALGVDFVRLGRLTVDAHAGPSLVGEMTTFLLERTHHDENGNEFENVCDLSAFEKNCTDSYRGVAALGLSGRGFIRRGGSWYLGLDYTWLSHGRHVVVGTVGWQGRQF
jgi:hypothetical protein